jgi:hypothetical protein
MKRQVNTILITSFHSLISRNILSTEIIKIFLRHGMRIVIVVPFFKKEYYQNIFAGPNIIIEGVKANQSTKYFFGLFFKRLSWNMLDTQTVRIKQQYQLHVNKKYFQYFFFFLPARMLSHFSFMVNFVRFLDYHLFSRKLFYEIFEKYNPCLVFATDVQNENDVIIMQEAKKRNIQLVGMVRSWDNLSQWGMIRIVPNLLIVNNMISAGEAQTLHHISKRSITVSGIPHYDRYLSGPYESKEQFFSRLGLDPNKKTIMHAPIGNIYVNDDQIDREILHLLSAQGVNVIVRLPPLDSVSSIQDLQYPNLYFNSPGLDFGGDGFTGREITEQDDIFLMNALYHSDVVTTGPSTIALDGALFNKPIVLINFYSSAKTKWDKLYGYDYDHIKRLIDSKGVRVANSATEFCSLLKMYLDKASIDENGRKYLIHTHCGLLDKEASLRVAQTIINEL